ncbi:MAG: fluoride efflux transporter CrcB [Pseudomarimonas sp.]
MSAPWWQQLSVVMAGGALGAALRFWLGGALLKQLGNGLPWGTLAANLIGAFAVGFIAVWLHGRDGAAVLWRAFLIVGFLGGLTTYSALMLEMLLFVRSQRTGPAITYLAATLVFGVLLVWLGAECAERLRGGR